MHGSSPHTEPLGDHPLGNMPHDRENDQQVKHARDSYVQQNERVGEGLSKVLLRLAQDAYALDRDKRLILFRNMIKAHQYVDGNFYGYVDHNLQWQTRDKAANEVWYSDNQLFPYFRTAIMELSRSQTKVEIGAANESNEAVTAAKFAQFRYNYNRSRTFRVRLKQTEISYALLNGITFRYTYMADSGRKEQVPILEDAEVKQKKSLICSSCVRPVPEPVDITGKGAPAEPTCPHCKSKMVRELDTSEGSETIIGYRELGRRENKWVVPNPIGVTISMTAGSIQESPYVIWKQSILRSVLQHRFPGLSLGEGGIQSVELQYIDDQQKATPGLTQGRNDDIETAAARDTDQGKEFEPVEYTQVWLDYPIYCNIKFEEDMPLGRGKTLPAGKPLGSMFKRGLYFSYVGTLVLDMWDEDKNRKWTLSSYGLRPGTPYGSAMFPALSDNERLNDLITLTMANAWHNGVPKDFVDPTYISELSSDPTQPTVLNQSVPQGRDIVGAAYGVAPPAPLSPEIYGLREEAKATIQHKIGSMSAAGTGGAADTEDWGDTATAISIKRDLAVGRFSPDLELMADELDVEQAYQILENEQEFFTAEQWKDAIGSYGEEGLKAFLNCDIRRDLVVSVAPGSWMPKSDAQTQAKLITWVTQMLPALIPIGDRELVGYAGSVFGIPEELQGYNANKAHAEKVTKRFTALAAEFVAQAGDAPTHDLTDPRVLQAAQAINDYARVPVDVFLDDHTALMDAYKDWRLTDAGRSASNVLLAAVDLRYKLHHDATTLQGQLLTKQQVDVTAPVEEKAKADQAEAMAAQQAAEAEAQEQQMMAEGAKMLVDQVEKDEERDFQREQAAMQAAREQDLEDRRLLAGETSE